MSKAGNIRVRMPAAQQAKIAARTQVLLTEEMTLRDMRVTKSSGNVFKDLGLPDADRLLAEADAKLTEKK